MENSNGRDTFVSVEEMRRVLGIGRTRAYEMVAERTIPAARVGKLIRIRKADIEEYLARHPY